MTADDYMAKAHRALAAARLLLDNDELEGACNRAYYSMFDAAHAALLAVGSATAESAPKKHSGLLSAFGLSLVKTRRIAPELGSAINKVERLRRLADYTGDPISDEDARWAVEQAGLLLSAIRIEFWPDVKNRSDEFLQDDNHHHPG